jgi:hypothetical protein
MEGDPDYWPVVVWNVRDDAYRFSMDTITFLHGYFSGLLPVKLLGPPPQVPWFDPYRKREHVNFKLSEGDLPYAERLRILREVLQPTADRGGYDGGEGIRQDHFKAAGRDWLLTYENCYGHGIRVAFPPQDEPEVRTVMFGAAKAMGCQVLATTLNSGEAIWT